MAYTGQPIVTRKRVIALKTETTLGTAESLTAAEGVLVVENPVIAYNGDATVIRPVGTYGVRQIVAGARPAAMNFDMLLSTGSTSPAFLDTIWEACGLIRSGAVYTHTIDNCSANGLTGGVWEGVGATARRKLIAGAFGEIEFSFTTGQPVRMSVALSGKMPSAPAADTAIAPTYTALTYPVFRGASLTIDSLEMLVDAFTLRLGNVVILRPSATHTDASGYHSAWIVDALATITIAPEAAAFSVIDFYDKHFGNTAIAFSAQVGSAANNTITFALPKMQLTRPPGSGDREGLVTDDLELQAVVTSNAYSGGLTITLS